jgi:predicted component of type VI protein secretion system
MEYDFDFQLVLEAAEVPRCQLGDVEGRGARLGWSSWLKSKEFMRDAADTIIAGRSPAMDMA